ncbi:hypothetical protein [Streptomyces sp. NPDC054887]
MTATPTTAGTMVAGSCADPRRRAAARRTGQLAAQEREVAVAAGRGGSNAEIAAALRTSVPTVRTYAHVRAGPGRAATTVSGSRCSRTTRASSTGTAT